MSDRGHNRHGPKRGGCCAPFAGGAGSPSNTKLPGPRPTSTPSGILIHAAIWLQQIWTEDWGLRPLFGDGAGSPSNIMSSGLSPASMRSTILIHPTVWPQYTNVTDRTDKTGETDRQTGQQSDSTGRTVLQMVAKTVRCEVKMLAKSLKFRRTFGEFLKRV